MENRLSSDKNEKINKLLWRNKLINFAITVCYVINLKTYYLFAFKYKDNALKKNKNTYKLLIKKKTLSFIFMIFYELCYSIINENIK